MAEKNIIKEAIQDANKIREAAVEQAKKDLLESLAPSIEQDITKRLFESADPTESKEKQDAQDTVEESVVEESKDGDEESHDEDSENNESEETHHNGEEESTEGEGETTDEDDVDALTDDDLSDIDFDEDIAVINDEDEDEDGENNEEMGNDEGMESEEGSDEDVAVKLAMELLKAKGYEVSGGEDGSEMSDEDEMGNESESDTHEHDEYTGEGDEEEDFGNSGEDSEKQILNDDEDIEVKNGDDDKIVIDIDDEDNDEDNDEEDLHEEYSVSMKNESNDRLSKMIKNSGTKSKNPNPSFESSKIKLIRENRDLKRALNIRIDAQKDADLVVNKAKLVKTLFNEHLSYANDKTKRYIIGEFDKCETLQESKDLFKQIINTDKDVKKNTKQSNKKGLIKENFTMKRVKRELLQDSKKIEKTNKPTMLNEAYDKMFDRWSELGGSK